MAIKDKSSIYDLSNGPVSNMETQQGPQFQRSLDNASQKHVSSLGEVPTTSQFQDLDGVPDSFYNRLDGTVNSPFQSETGDHMVDLLTKNAKSTNSELIYTPAPNQSQFQDLNGLPGPQSQLPTDAASQKHIDSLQSVPGPPSNSPFQDLNGLPGPQSQLPIADASQKHIDSLTQQSTYQFDNSSATVGPSNLDLNGARGPESQKPIRDASQRHIDSLTKQIQITNQGVGTINKPYNIGPSTLDLNGNPGPLFNRGADSTLKQDSLANIYKSSVNPGASFGAGQKGGTWPNVRPTPVGANFADLDGLTPRGYVNPDTGASF